MKLLFAWFRLFTVLSFLGCDGPICIGDLTPAQWEFCNELIETYGDPPASEPPGEDPVPPNSPTPQVHCDGLPEGHHPPANGRECSDRVDNDCDGRMDDGAPSCLIDVCSPAIGSRCSPGTHCLMAEAKCVPDDVPPRTYCWGDGWNNVCQRCPVNNGIGVVCVIIDGIAEILLDSDSDGIPDQEDLCPWYNPGNSPCPEGDADVDGDFVPDESDSCPFVSNSMDSEGAFCVGHPEVNCQELFPEFPAQMVVNEDFAWCDHFLPGVNTSVRFCDLDWFIQISGNWPDLCLNCGDIELPMDHACTLQNGWFAVTVLDSDADGYPDHYPQSDGGFLSLDNCPIIANQDQLDSDVDGLGDACDP